VKILASIYLVFAEFSQFNIIEHNQKCEKRLRNTEITYKADIKLKKIIFIF
jgi:hypothetical protein